MKKNIFADQALCKDLLNRLIDLTDRPFTFMEVCGTHTVAFFRSGLRTLLPKDLIHLSGPGCPVCVTSDSEIASSIELAKRSDCIIATFGDLMRVPAGKGLSLKKAKAEGARIEVVYSPLDALRLAVKSKGDKVVFLGVGFETTAPAVAATILEAAEQKIDNFLVFCCHKLVPPALRKLMIVSDVHFNALLLPGNVSVILGLAPYRFLGTEFNCPAVVGGFETADLLQSLILLLKQYKQKEAKLENQYSRFVSETGNLKAQEILHHVFEVVSTKWRGFGEIENSGLKIKDEYVRHDVMQRFGLTLTEVKVISGCACADILCGKIKPPECPHFAKICTPHNPLGPCMVSTEGSCSAYFNYAVS